MLILKIKDRGHFINIPGLPPLRTPVNVKADRLDLRLAEMALRRANIKNYEIVSVEEVQEPKKQEVKYVEIPIKERDDGSKIEKLEAMLELLLSRELEKTTDNREQINKKLDSLEKLIIEKSNRDPIEITKNSSDPIIEEIEDSVFIPSIDIDDMKLKGESGKKIIKQEDKFDENADLLASLLGSKGDL